ncbi:MAG TPA: superoxide dismutase [Caulobacteraceae bacterium]|nr:superoxide dismutase [Caulobacteraceae bacterium]
MFPLPELPYAYTALEPVISARTLRFHHDKHHRAYVEATNDLLPPRGAGASLEDVIRRAPALHDGTALFNNAAQAWNHAFFWVSMTGRRDKPSTELIDAITASFGDLRGLRERFVEAGATHFGSGWVWLASNNLGRLSLKTTHDAGNLLSEPDAMPLLTCDLWEHAYYLDHQNDRRAFLAGWFDLLANWSLASVQFAAARGVGEAWHYPTTAGRPAMRRAG